ncbi:MAG: 1-acyl-sn-glycerol-3-phosphate acyltransferase [Acidimicrobiales bacterium]
MGASVPGPWVRRPISITLVTVLALTCVVVAIPALLLSAAADVITRTPRLRRTRLSALICAFVLVDFAGMVLVALVWLTAPLGINIKGARTQRWYRWVMTWWTSAIMWSIRRIVPLPFDTSELDPALLAGNAIVIGRHRSLLDAVLPATLFGKRGLTVMYTLKEDLRWEPNIDLVGHRMTHRFVTRNPQDLEAELQPIRDLAAELDAERVAVIFPEGTFFNEERKARVVASLEVRDPERVDAARSMAYVLAPRPAGTMALLDGSPDADVIMLGHVGFEPFGSRREIVRNIGAQHPIRLRAWRYPRREIPEDPEARIDWLFERWLEMDEWIASHHPLGRARNVEV